MLFLISVWQVDSLLCYLVTAAIEAVGGQFYQHHTVKRLFAELVLLLFLIIFADDLCKTGQLFDSVYYFHGSCSGHTVIYRGHAATVLALYYSCEYIHLKAGEQKLDGEESVQLLRFRSGYAMADLERVNVQRAFVQAAMEQWVNPMLIFRGPAALAAVRNDTTTDLSVGNLIWIARAMIGCDFADITTNTLPGQPQMINGGSYFVADQTATAQMMQEIYSPYID